MAVGVALPNLEGLRPTGSGIRPPRLWATTVFLLVVALAGTPALVGVGWGDRVGAAAGVPHATVAAVGVVATLAVAAALAVVSYRRALAAIANYTVE
jgi:hypothetical protein